MEQELDTAAMAAELKMRVSRLRPLFQKRLRDKLLPREKTLTLIRERFVNEYVIDLNADRAAKAVGCSKQFGWKMCLEKYTPEVYHAIHKKLAELELMSELKAEYVREYIKSVMEFCPTDFFLPAPEGGWLIAQGDYGKLPHNIKRLIEDVELRNIRGNTFLAVRFVSKSASLALAARYTLTQNINATVSAVPWDEVVREMEEAPQTEDAVEQRLNAMVRLENTD